LNWGAGGIRELMLDANKIELLLKYQKASFPESVSTTLVAHCRNIDVIYHTSPSLENHIMAICKAAFYHYWNISRIRKYLSSQMAEMLVHVFVSSRLDYFNSLLYGLSKESPKKLQHVQNAAARIVMHMCK